MTTLFDDVRKTENLHLAWRHVRRSALQSKNGQIRGQASEFEHESHRHLKRIQTQLRERRFGFDAVQGVLKDKKTRIAAGKNPRPIAIGTMTNRVVQRAILQVLQPRAVEDPSNPNSKYLPKHDARLGVLNDINRSKFGVGGLMKPYGGVQPAIKRVLIAMENGGRVFYQSDIKAFFTKIPTKEVIDIVRAQTQDDDLSALFASALEVNLANKAELDTYASLFPKGGIGVAQGSSLSALAGNILLYDFDHELNGLEVTAVRYIDDLFIIGETDRNLNLAIQFAETQLQKWQFELYPPVKGSTKANRGICTDSFNLLGCTIQPNRCVPSKASVDKMKSEAREMLNSSRKAIDTFVKGDPNFDPRKSRSATLDNLGRRLFGWQKSFSFCTDAQTFRHLDDDISRQVGRYDRITQRLLVAAPASTRMRALGIPSTASLQEADMDRRSKIK
ncbi:reverse transcriptase domain-containing protein [Henriciella litoralis]|uniref:reverse transcriptase domain-containing protein n=1 Tax=Henriciella litoralis TaxID=568102 RepID=UPI0009FE4EDB|nr:reverse transcriptase domain-containing protein [Henriciella litoralis]